MLSLKWALDFVFRLGERRMSVMTLAALEMCAINRLDIMSDKTNWGVLINLAAALTVVHADSVNVNCLHMYCTVLSDSCVFVTLLVLSGTL